MQSAVNLLRDSFKLTDDQILNIATCESYLNSVYMLRVLLFDKWRVPLKDAYNIVMELKKELL